MSVRVYELSKEIGMENQQLIEILRARNYQIRTASSTIDNISADSLRKEFGIHQPVQPTTAHPEPAKPAEAKQPEPVTPANPGKPPTAVATPAPSEPSTESPANPNALASSPLAAPPSLATPPSPEQVLPAILPTTTIPHGPASKVPVPASNTAPQAASAPRATDSSTSAPGPVTSAKVPAVKAPAPVNLAPLGGRAAPPPVAPPRGGKVIPPAVPGRSTSSAPFSGVIPSGAIVRTRDEIEKERQERIEAQRKSALVAPPPVRVANAPQNRAPGTGVPPVRTPTAPAPSTPRPQEASPASRPAPQLQRMPSTMAPPSVSAPTSRTGPEGLGAPPSLPRPETLARRPESPAFAPIETKPAERGPQPQTTREPSPVIQRAEPPAVHPPPASPPPPAGGPRNLSPPPAPQPEPSTDKSKGKAKDVLPLSVRPPIIVRDFAGLIGLRPFQLISELMEMGIFASMNQVIEPEVAVNIALKHNFLLEIKHRGEVQQQPAKPKEEPKIDESKLLEPRPPVVCILGHVDHGKTTLLDVIRKSNVAAGEAGGITQHIGAYQIEHEGKKITFIDTPGHAAFANMRARGANTTDIAVLVVAADDGFMKQTDEALNHARQAKVPVVVAINKIDAKGANIDRVKQQCQERGLTPEDWGGDTLVTPVSALKGTNISQLLDSILLQAELMEDLKANPKSPAEGVIIEAQKEVGRGPTATAIIQKGTLRPGDALVSGPYYCKVRQLLNDAGKPIKAAPPSTPVKIVGWSDTPESGLRFQAVENEKEAKSLAEENALEIKRQTSLHSTEGPNNAEELLAVITQSKTKVFKVLVKADVYGTAEALALSLEAIKSTKIEMEVVKIGVGPITKNDVTFAASAKASIVAFDIGLDTGVGPIAKHHGVTIYQHNIIYELIDIVKNAMADQLEPELKEVKLGAAEVRAIFPVAKGFVAGCMVTEGRIQRDARARILRKGKLEHDSQVSTLRRFKDDVSEVRSGFECGIRVSNFDGYQIGDVIECYEIQKIRASL